MKILIGVPEYPPYNIGGGGEVFSSIAEKLKSFGHEVHVFYGYYPNRKIFPKIRTYQKNGIYFYEIPEIPFPAKFPYFKTVLPVFPWTYFSVKKLIQEINPDVANIHGYGLLFINQIAFILQTLGIRYVYTLHGAPVTPGKKMGILNFIYKVYEKTWGKNILSNASKITSVSEYTKTFKEFSKYKDQIEVIFNGINYYDFNEFIANEETIFSKYIKNIDECITFFSLGRIEWLKGFQLFISTMSKLKSEGLKIKYFIGGIDNGYKDELSKLINQLDLSDDVIFLGLLDFEKKCNCYKYANYIVVPSLVENFPAIPLEAQSMNKIVIGNKVAGIPETIEDNHTGILVDFENSTESAQKISELIKNKKKQSQIISNTRSVMKFDWYEIVKKYENLLNTVYSSYSIQNKSSNFINKIFAFLVEYILPISIIFAITIYYFQSLYGLNGVLAYNDYVLPKSLSDLNSYLNNLTIYNFSSNLGSVRSNFLSDLPTLIILKCISIFFDYQFATKLTQTVSFAISGIAFFLVIKRITKKSLLAFLLSLLAIFNLWGFDRLQQGHYYLLGPFLAIFVFIIYYRFFSEKWYKNIVLGHLLFLALFTYYHYAIIAIYLFAIDFIIEFIFNKNKFKVLKENSVVASIFFVDSLLYILPYTVSALNTFRNLSQTVSNLSDLRIFSWQSMAISEIFHVRLGMYSYKLSTENSLLLLILVGFIILYYFFFRKNKSNHYKYIEFKLKVLFIIFAFLGFGIWLNIDFFANFIYKIPTFAVFRDMNKFVGVSFIIFIFILAIKAKEVFANKKIFSLEKIVFITAILLFVSPITLPYNMFLVYNQDEIYNFNDTSTFTVVSFPSYPITGVYYNDVYYHKYLPSLVATNDLRTLSIPYYNQKDQYEVQYDMFRSLYQKFNFLTKEQIYSELGKFGTKYIVYYKRYDFKSKNPIIDRWYRSIDLPNKLSLKEIIFENNDIIVYQIPQEFYKKYINLSENTDYKFKVINDAEVEVIVKFKSQFNLNQIVNSDKNWKIEVENANDVDFTNYCIQNISKDGNQCIVNKSYDYNFSKQISRIFNSNVNDYVFNQNSNEFNQWVIGNDFVKTNSQNIKDDGEYKIIKLRLTYLPNAFFIIGQYILLASIILTIIVIFRKIRLNSNVQSIKK